MLGVGTDAEAVDYRQCLRIDHINIVRPPVRDIDAGRLTRYRGAQPSGSGSAVEISAVEDWRHARYRFDRRAWANGDPLKQRRCSRARARDGRSRRTEQSAL